MKCVPLSEPSVGYDHKGAAYAAGIYFDNQAMGTGFVAVQKSTDGTRWSKPVVALGHPGQAAPSGGGGLAVDASPSSPWVNKRICLRCHVFAPRPQEAGSSFPFH